MQSTAKVQKPYTCSVQNDQTSKACTKVLRDLNFVHRRAADKPCIIIEVEKHFCTTPLWFYHFVHCCIGFCTERYGNLMNQQFFFPVNGNFVCSCLGLMGLNLMRFNSFCTLECYFSGKNMYTAIHQSTALYKKISAALEFFRMQ